MDNTHDHLVRMESLSTGPSSGTKEEDHETLDASQARLERRVKLKLDFTILPLLTSIQFLAQMAKSDLGNANVAGMGDELKISPTDYSHTAAMLLVGFLVFQIPGTVLIRKIGPPYQFGGAMIMWGVFTTCLVAANTLGSLMALRVLIGAAEAFIQGSLLYLTYWYRPDELATRGAFFTATAALAGAFNGIIANAIQTSLDGHNGWRAWRWIFLIEGIVPIGWGFLVVLLLPGTPESVQRLFSRTEKEIVLSRSRAAHNTGDSKIRPKAMLQVLMDPTFWMLAVIDLGVHFTESSLPSFIPSIIVGIGWEGNQAQLMSSIVYACAFVGIMFWARVADKTGHRGLLIVVNCVIGIVGFILLRFLASDVGRLIAVCVVATGVYPCVLLTIVWLALCVPGYSQRSSALAFINMIAQLFAILGNEVYNDPPFYYQGIMVSAILLAVAGFMAAALLWRLKLLNRKKMAQKDTADARESNQRSIDELGNKHPGFMYGY